MTHFYKIILFLIVFCSLGETQAQKTLRIRVSNVQNTPGTDCDGAISGDSDWEWQFSTGACIEIDNNSANNEGQDVTLFGTNTYYSRNCWPTGNYTIGFRGLEDDGVSNCDNDCGQSYSNDSSAYRAYNTANGTYTDWSGLTYATTCGCQGEGAGGSDVTITYTYSAQQIIGGSAFSATNLDGNGFVNNTTCATARNLGSGTGFSAAGDYATQCTETWYYYDLTANSNTLTIDPSQNGSTVDIWYSATNSCADRCFRASGGGAATVHGAPAGRYYFRLTASNEANTNIAISRTATSRDQIKFATNVALNYSASVNNGSYTESPGEPNPAGNIYNTWWYEFTTPAGGYPFVSASISEGTGNNSAVAIYRSNGANCTDFGESLTTLASDRWCASSGGSVSTNCLTGNTKYYVQYGTAENFALCIGGENTGSYNVSINTGSPSGNDNLCSPHDFGTLNAGANTGWLTRNNSCLGTQSGEPRLADMSNTMWYRFTTPASGLVSANIEVEEAGEGANYTAMAIYRRTSTCSFGGITEVGFDRWCGSDGGNVEINCLLPNTEYYIQVGTGYNFALCTDLLNGGRSTGAYRVRVTTSSRTAGPDNICNAQSMGTFANYTSGTISLPTINNHSNECATLQANEPGGGDKSTWYTFTTGNTVGKDLNITVDASDGYDAEVYIYRACGTVCTGSTLNAGVLTEIANYWDALAIPAVCIGTWDASGTLSNVIRPNTTYYIRVDGLGACDVDGPYNLSISMSGGTYIANDNYCAAHNLSSSFNWNSSSIAHTVNTDNASSEDICNTNEPNSSDDQTAWWRFTTGANPPAIITVNPDAGGLCTGQAWAYSGAAVGACTGSSFTNYNASPNNFNGLTEIGSSTLGGGFDLNCLAPNTTYYIMGKVGGVCSSGSLTINLESNGAPKFNNDICTNAISLGTFTTGGQTLGNASNTNRWNNFCMNDVGDPDPGWLLDPNARQLVWFRFNTGDLGRVVDISAFSDPGNHGDEIDIKLALYKGPCGSLSYVDRDYDPTLLLCADGLCDEDMPTQYCLDPNTDYYVLVDGSGLNTQGFFGLTVKDGGPYPANDLPCNATVSTVQPFNVYTTTDITNQSNVRGTDCFEPDPGWTSNGNDHGVWYKFNSLPGRRLVIDANNTGSDDIDIQLAFYEGDPNCSNLDYVNRDWFLSPLFCVDGLCDEDFIITECLDPTKEYYVMVDGGSSLGINGAMHEGTFDLKFYFPREGGLNPCLYNAATNNTGAPRVGTGAIPTGGSVQLLNNSNFCGLSDADLTAQSIPLPAWGADNAVWYVFRPPASGSVKITGISDPVIGPALGFASGDEIDIQLAVYEASGAAGSCTPPSWSIVASASNSITLDGFNEYVVANCLDPNKDYYILIDGTGLNTVGFFDIIIEDYGITTPNDLQCDAIDIVAAQTPALQAQWASCYQNMTLTLNDQNNYCADNVNEPVPSNWPGTAKIVWYKFVAPPSGGVYFELNTVTSNPFAPEYINGKLALYDLPDGEDICTYLFTPADEIASDYNVDVPPVSTGEDLNNNNPLFPDNRFVYCLEPGRTYYLAVDGQQEPLTSDWDRGEFSISIESSDRDTRAPNNEVCDAKFLGNLTFQPLGHTVTTTPPPARGETCMRAENNFCAHNEINGVPYPTSPGGTFGVNFDVDQAVWYRFIAPWTTAVEIRALNDPNSIGDQIDLQVGVFESSNNACGGDFQQIKGEYDAGFFSETVQVNCLEPGKPYWVMIDGSGLNTQGYFELEIEVVLPTELAPPNDDICDAIAVNPFAGTVNRSNDRNRCATLEASIPEPSTFEKDFTVWYRFNTPTTGGPFAVRVEVTSSLPWPFGDLIDPQIAVYKSDNNLCTGNITEHFSDYSTLGLPFFERADVHCLEPDTRYFVMVDGSLLNLQGFYDISFETITPNPIAVNNDICNVHDFGTLGATGGSTLGGLGGGDPLWNNFCSDTEPGEYDPDAFGIDQTVWFKFKTPLIAGPSDGVNVNIYADNDFGFGDQIDLQVAVYQSSDNTCTGTLTEIESSYNPALPLLNFFDEEMDLCLREDTEYWIQVDGSALNTQGYFKLRIRNDGAANRPVNDDFCNATPITVGTPLTGQNNLCATVELGEPLAGFDVQKSVWYKFTAPASGRVEIRTIDADGAISGIDPEWYLYEFDGTCTGGVFTGTFTELDNAYFPTIEITNPDDVSDYECLFPGREYYIQVDGTTVGGAEGVFDISVSNISVTVPSNNTCASATALSVNTESCQYSTGTWSNRNYGTATRTLDDVSGCGSNCGDTWYSFVMPATGFAKIEGDDEFGTFGSNNSQLVINAFRGVCGSLTQIQCDNGGVNKDPDFSITGTPGEIIYLQVYSANGNDDDNKEFAICVSERCSADECPDYITMTLGEDYCWDVRDATGENSGQGYPVCGAPTDPEKTVYFRFDTDDFCWGYQITIETPELSANGNCLLGNSPSSELVLSVYQDNPGSLCDGTPIAVLDCETFNDCQWPSGVNWTQTYLVGPAVNNIKTNATYVIQLNARDGLPFVTSDDVVDGLIRVRKLCDGREWEYAPLGVTSSTGYCEDADGWRHYYNDGGTPADPSDDILIFSVRPNGNTFDGTATIRLENTPFSSTNATAGSWVMRRHWDFNMTSGSINPAFPVDVRFYYLDSEKNEIITAAQTFATNNGLTYEPFEWFKSANGSSYWANPGPFAPAFNITPEYVIAQYGSGLATLAPQPLNAQDHDADPTNEWCNGVQYVDITGLIGFSGGSGATGAGTQPSPLPVELVEFTGYHDEQQNFNVLNWITASELNNDYFVVQRSVDGVNFINIGQVEGNGTTNESSNYTFNDENPAIGKNYYRLRQVDFDGTSEFSDVIEIEVSSSVVATQILNYYPNPTTDKLYIEMQVAEDGAYNIIVVDVTGKVVHNDRVDLIKSNRHLIELDASYFAQGGYIVTLEERLSGERHQFKFIKQ